MEIFSLFYGFFFINFIAPGCLLQSPIYIATPFLQHPLKTDDSYLLISTFLIVLSDIFFFCILEWLLAMKCTQWWLTIGIGQLFLTSRQEGCTLSLLLSHSHGCFFRFGLYSNWLQDFWLPNDPFPLSWGFQNRSGFGNLGLRVGYTGQMDTRFWAIPSGWFWKLGV